MDTPEFLTARAIVLEYLITVTLEQLFANADAPLERFQAARKVMHTQLLGDLTRQLQDLPATTHPAIQREAEDLFEHMMERLQGRIARRAQTRPHGNA